MRLAPALLLPLLLLTSGYLAAGEGSILQQLQNETRALSKKAGSVLVGVASTGDARTVYNANAGTRALFYDVNGVPVRYPVATTWTMRQRATFATGVLVGKPPRIAVAYAVVANRDEVEVKLPDGRKVKAKRAFSDSELGVAIYDLPEDERGKWTGLAVARDWNEMTSGSIVVGTAGRGIVDLRTIHVTDSVLGLVTLGERSKSPVLLGATGELVSLRGDGSVPWNKSCEQCHAGKSANWGNVGAWTSARVAYTNAVAQTNPTRPGGWFYQPHGQTYGGPVARAGVPGPVLARVLDDLNEHKRVQFGYLGVILGDQVRSDGRGVRVAAVLDDSPAAAAGLRTGEWISKIDGASVGASSTLSRALLLRRPGEKVRLTVSNGGKESREIEATLGDSAKAKLGMVTPGGLGFTVWNLGPELRQFFGVKDDVRGVVVHNCTSGTAAYKAGLRRGDVIVWGQDSPIADLEELNAAVAAASGTLKLRALRRGKQIELSIKLPRTKPKTR